MPKWIHRKKLSTYLLESEKNQDQKDWSALSRHHTRLRNKHSKFASRQSEMDYSFSTIHPDIWKDKRELVNHWVNRVYHPKDGSSENENFWKNEIKTIHWLGFFSTKPLVSILERYLSKADLLQAELSAIGYFPGTNSTSYKVGIKIKGTPVYASSADLYTEFLSTLTDNVIERFFDNYEKIVKTPNLKVDSRHILTSKHDALYRKNKNKSPRINEVIVSDWDIDKIFISVHLKDDIKKGLLDMCDNYNVEYELFDRSFTI